MTLDQAILLQAIIYNLKDEARTASRLGCIGVADRLEENIRQLRVLQDELNSK